MLVTVYREPLAVYSAGDSVERAIDCTVLVTVYREPLAVLVTV